MRPLNCPVCGIPLDGEDEELHCELDRLDAREAERRRRPPGAADAPADAATDDA
jgi:hypothetical protein